MKTRAIALNAALIALFAGIAVPLVAKATPPQETSAASYDTYKSWWVACDNGLTCEAKGFASGGEASADLRFIRAAGPDGSLEARLQVVTHASIDLDDLRVDGKPLRLDASAWSVNLDSTNDIATLSTKRPAAVAAFVSRLRNGARLEVGSDTNAYVPLDGLAAALLRIDDRQGRIGGVSALIRKGLAPASQVTPAPSLPVVPARKIAAQLSDQEEARLIARTKRIQDASSCEENASAHLEEAAYALDSRNALVFLPCIAGAYQGSSDVFIAPRTGGGAPQPIKLGGPVGGVMDPSLVEPHFDPATGTLSTFAKGRGLADCGFQAEWIWDGRAFQISAASQQETCGGTAPGDWPTLYRSRKK
ncbi:DUF1176 domain-containing protein [Burkholderia lata]|uniref:DUF1176 domain-containing protein n=1 Tax=Burkholderia lata (strain ATCC 17760 / DSM 23089 / LMG 22485 / NCIMB 9086 / R18194 / 383) TaxID=482957 RepID=Q392N3_BURL3|nr:DUF1176 domain-containing protein [Burkholderia lata]ABB12583.1 hypothetical protein Bcep18194_B2472 [Burkholderia lata]